MLKRHLSVGSVLIFLAFPPAMLSAPGTEFRNSDLFRLRGAGPVHVGSVVGNVPLGIGNPSEYCLDDGFIWKGSPFRLGSLNLFGSGVKDVRPGTMIVYGAARKSLDDVVRKDRKCPPDYRGPPQQLRSDWTSPECGFNIGHSTHARLRTLSYIDVKAAFPLRMIEVLRLKGKGIRLRLTNPFDVSLEGLNIRAHYEGGGGKPKPRYAPIEARPAPGKTVEVGVDPVYAGPGEDVREGRRAYRLRSIQITGTIQDAEFDVDHPVR